MIKLSYRDIIRENIRQAVLQKNKCKDKDEECIKHYEWTIVELISDLRNYESKEKIPWLREPRDKAWEKYGRQVHMMNIDELFDRLRKMFGEDW